MCNQFIYKYVNLSAVSEVVAICVYVHFIIVFFIIAIYTDIFI